MVQIPYFASIWWALSSFLTRFVCDLSWFSAIWGIGAVFFVNRGIQGSSTVQEWIAWINRHMLPYVPIHLQNRCSYLFPPGVKQDLLRWISFRWEVTPDHSFLTSIKIVAYYACSESQLAASDENPRQFLNMPEEELEMVLSQVTDNNLRHTLQFGIGLHHAGLNDKDRSFVEELFANNKIQVFVFIVIYFVLGFM